jgi:deazaflavin-dependent oxidoreductase (nitroreductase family)
MPLSRRMAKFNRRLTNHLTCHIANWAPGFALIEHVGRRSGRVYRTPVNVIKGQGRYIFALTYGDSEWVKNVMANGGCVIETRRHRIQLAKPERFRDPSRHFVPVPARWVLKLVDVEDFVALRPL